MTAVIFTARSKTGPIPVTTSSAETCPFQSQGCYAKSGPFSLCAKAGPNATFQNGRNPAHADELADLDVGPVVTVLPSTIVGFPAHGATSAVAQL